MGIRKGELAPFGYLKGFRQEGQHKIRVFSRDGDRRVGAKNIRRLQDGLPFNRRKEIGAASRPYRDILPTGYLTLRKIIIPLISCADGAEAVANRQYFPVLFRAEIAGGGSPAVPEVLR